MFASPPTADIFRGGKKQHLGTFSTALEAARAYDKVARTSERHVKSNLLNFPADRDSLAECVAEPRAKPRVNPVPGRYSRDLVGIRVVLKGGDEKKKRYNGKQAVVMVRQCAAWMTVAVDGEAGWIKWRPLELDASGGLATEGKCGFIELHKAGSAKAEKPSPF